MKYIRSGSGIWSVDSWRQKQRLQRGEPFIVILVLWNMMARRIRVRLTAVPHKICEIALIAFVVATTGCKAVHRHEISKQEYRHASEGRYPVSD
jgi:hypothetical protein